MKISWYPRHLVTGLLLFVVFALALNVAVDAHRGAVVGLLAIVVCAIVDVIFTINPASWGWLRRRRT
jgi:hypothetical protein